MSNVCLKFCKPTFCHSCAADVIQEILELLQSHNNVYQHQLDDLDLFIESQREDLLRVIENQNEETRQILRAKSSGETVSICDSEKIDIWRKIRWGLNIFYQRVLFLTGYVFSLL